MLPRRKFIVYSAVRQRTSNTGLKFLPASAPRGLLVGLLLVLLSGCETIGYYRQAIGGQLAVTFARQPVARVLADPKTPPALAERLRASQRMLAYIENTVGLASDGRYRSYVALDRDAVVYNLVATEAFSVSAERWCYPIAGCAPYRGYFRRQAADRAAARYQAQGFTTHVGAVPAYSTLGWFADPLLSTFVHWNDAQLITLLAHELSHSRVWVASDVSFNEAFATFVGEQTARNWLGRDNPELLQQQAQRQQQWQRLVHLLLQLKEHLRGQYAAPLDASAKAAATANAYAAMQRCYQDHRQRLGDGRFDAYLGRLNNATLAALATYRANVPAFAALYQESGGRWPEFFTATEALAKLPAPERAARLQRLRVSNQQQITQRGDDQDAEQIQCQAFTDHGVDWHLP